MYSKTNCCTYLARVSLTYKHGLRALERDFARLMHSQKVFFHSTVCCIVAAPSTNHKFKAVLAWHVTAAKMSQWYGQYTNHKRQWYGGQWHSDWGCWKSDGKWRSDWVSDDQWQSYDQWQSDDPWHSDWKDADQWQSDDDWKSDWKSNHYYDSDDWGSWPKPAMKEEGEGDAGVFEDVLEEKPVPVIKTQPKPKPKRVPQPPATPPPAALLAKVEKERKLKTKMIPLKGSVAAVAQMHRGKKVPKHVAPPKKRQNGNSLPEAWAQKPTTVTAPVTLADLDNEKTSFGPTLAGLVGDAETTPQDPKPPAPTFPKSAMPKAKSAAGWMGPKLGLEAHTREAAQCFAASAAAAAGGLFIPLPPMPLLPSPDGFSGCNASSLIDVWAISESVVNSFSLSLLSGRGWSQWSYSLACYSGPKQEAKMSAKLVRQIAQREIDSRNKQTCTPLRMPS